jgi:tetratricopeptide (TPR) repeat protein
MRLHQRIGRALEAAYGARQMEIAPQLAVHFERGRDAARAVHYLAAAGASARQRFANREAIDYLETALALVERSSEEGERCRLELQLRLQLGVALSTVHGFASQRVRENYERASELCTKVGSATQLFDVQYARWYLHAIHGDRDKAIAIAAELESLARRLRTPEHWLLADSVQVRTALYDGRFAETSRRMQRLLARQRRRKPAAAAVAYGADPLIAATSHCAMALWFLGHPERAQTSARAAIAQARESGHSFTLTAVLMQAALVNLLCRNPVEGGDLACEAVAVSVEHGFAFWNAVTSLLTGWALVQQGQASEGGAAIERALDAMQATGTRFFSAFAYAFLAEARLHTGALDDGVTAADAGLAVANSTLDRAYEPELWRLKGELLEEKSKVESSKPQARRVKVGYGRPGTAEQALACFQRALDLARAAEAKSLELRAATSLARAWQARRRSADARKVLGSVCKWFGKGAGTADLGEARTLLAEL